jgi:hypothetical protein
MVIVSPILGQGAEGILVENQGFSGYLLANYKYMGVTSCREFSFGSPRSLKRHSNLIDHSCAARPGGRVTIARKFAI